MRGEHPVPDPGVDGCVGSTSRPPRTGRLRPDDGSVTEGAPPGRARTARTRASSSSRSGRTHRRVLPVNGRIFEENTLDGAGVRAEHCQTLSSSIRQIRVGMGKPESRKSSPGGGPALLALVTMERSAPAQGADRARDAASGDGQHRHLLHRAARGRETRWPHRGGADTGSPDAALRPRLRRRLLLAETLWRVGLHCLNRLDALGIESLYVIGMDELFAKDAAFFHDNFAAR